MNENGTLKWYEKTGTSSRLQSTTTGDYILKEYIVISESHSTPKPSSTPKPKKTIIRKKTAVLILVLLTKKQSLAQIRM